MTPAVAQAFETIAQPERAGLLKLRDLIFAEAKALPQVGPIEEALRWGHPSYLTPTTKAGSTLRLGVLNDGRFAIFASCQSTIIDTYAEMFGDQDQIVGNRAVAFDHADQIAPERLRYLIRHGLTYHLAKKVSYENV